MNYNLHASINNVVDHVFSLRDQLLLEKDETVELLKQVRECQSIDDVLNLAISDPEDFLVTMPVISADLNNTAGQFSMLIDTQVINNFGVGQSTLPLRVTILALP